MCKCLKSGSGNLILNSNEPENRGGPAATPFFRKETGSFLLGGITMLNLPHFTSGNEHLIIYHDGSGACQVTDEYGRVICTGTMVPLGRNIYGQTVMACSCGGKLYANRTVQGI